MHSSLSAVPSVVWSLHWFLITQRLGIPVLGWVITGSTLIGLAILLFAVDAFAFLAISETLLALGLTTVAYGITPPWTRIILAGVFGLLIITGVARALGSLQQSL